MGVLIVMYALLKNRKKKTCHLFGTTTRCICPIISYSVDIFNELLDTWLFQVIMFILLMMCFTCSYSDFNYLMMLVRWIICTCFLWMLTPYLHVYGVCVCFIFLFIVFDAIKGGSRSHLLVKIYTMYHSLTLLV